MHLVVDTTTDALTTALMAIERADREWFCQEEHDQLTSLVLGMRGARDEALLALRDIERRESRPWGAPVDGDDREDDDGIEAEARALYEGPGHMDSDLPWPVLTDQSREAWRERARRQRPKEPS